MLALMAVMKFSATALLSLGITCIALQPAPARANGQTTHVWITEQALEFLQDGELSELLRDPQYRDPLLNGAMFPDGGYAVNDNYGELAHWEPFQQAYLQWIRETFEPPWNEGEAASHVAFLMGLGSHGMADEVFDSLFMERSRLYDPGWDGGTSNLDTASDVLFAAAVGGIAAPDPWLPIDAVLPLFNEVLGYEVEAGTIESGHAFLFSALSFTEWARSDEERLTTFTAEFPWTAENINNATVAGSPPREAEVIARYWGDLWARLHDPTVWAQPVMELVPAPSSSSHPTAAESIDARLHLSFSRGVEQGSLGAISVLDDDGRLLPIDVHHHYGDFSHAVHILPLEDWPEGTSLRIRVEGELLNYDGVSFGDTWTGEVATGAPTAESCGCSASPSVGPESLAWAFAVLLTLGCSRRRRSDR